MEIIGLTASPAELELMALKMILNVIAVNVAVLSAATFVGYFLNLLLCSRGARR